MDYWSLTLTQQAAMAEQKNKALYNKLSVKWEGFKFPIACPEGKFEVFSLQGTTASGETFQVISVATGIGKEYWHLGNVVDVAAVKNVPILHWNEAGDFLDNLSAGKVEFGEWRNAMLKIAASSREKKKWDPSARFWNGKIAGNNDKIPIYLTFDLPHRLNTVDIIGLLRAYVEHCLVDTNLELAQSITEGFSYTGIGCGPRNLFSMFVKSTDFPKLCVAWAYPDPGDPKAEEAHSILFKKSPEGKPFDPHWELWRKVLITVDKVKMAQDYANQRFPRKPTQKVVMNNKSATELAAALLGPTVQNVKGKSEWLHRSAFSFGGLGDHSGDVNSSQVPHNFIWGTCEANTAMLLPEAFVKLHTLVQKIDNGTVTTRVSNGNAWFARELEYIYEIGGEVVLKLYINPFQRFRPLRLEALLWEKLLLLLQAAESGADNITVTNIFQETVLDAGVNAGEFDGDDSDLEDYALDIQNGG